MEGRCDSLPPSIAALSIQFALSGDNLETALARLPGMSGHGKSSWELLDKVMSEFLPVMEDAQSIHVCFHRILDAMVKTKPERAWDVLKRMEEMNVAPNNVTCSILLKGVQRDMKEGYLTKVMKVIDDRGALWREPFVRPIVRSRTWTKCFWARSTKLASAVAR